jgi:hypothetical protein
MGGLIMTNFNDPMGNAMFTIVPIIITIVFVSVFGLIIFTIIKGISTWNKNNAQPKLTVLAKLVSKRADMSTHMHNDNDNFSHSNTSTTYFVTFEVASGDRLEFDVTGNEYGLLIEQDKGDLTFQGTRYLGFKRII